MACIAIDPGIKGGIAWVDHDGIVRAVEMPDGMIAQAELLTDLARSIKFGWCWIERTGTYRPGNSAVAACTFARHCGHLEAICYMLQVPVQQITPTAWQKPLCLPKDKAERKRAVKELMARRYPHLNVTQATADALAILTWAME
jgi:hypothetical protein